MQKISPFLWFDDKAEEAVNFYVSIFKNSKIGTITHYGEEGADLLSAKASLTNRSTSSFVDSFCLCTMK